jgi:hypothetical protein
VVFMAFLLKKAIKTYKCNRLLGACRTLVNFCIFMQKFRLPGLLWEFARYKFAINCKFIRFLGNAPQTPRCQASDGRSALSRPPRPLPLPRKGKPHARRIISGLIPAARKLCFRLYSLSSDRRSAASQTADRRSEVAKAHASDRRSARTFGSPLPVVRADLRSDAFPDEVHWGFPLYGPH